MSFCHFTQFCNLTKLGIEKLTSFVYNVFIVVRKHPTRKAEGNTLPERRFENHVYSKFYSQHLLAGP